VGYVDFILNLAGLLLWLNWRSIRFDPLIKRTPATLMGTLRPAAPKKVQRWHFLVFIFALLCLRALIYRWLGGALGWTGQLDLGVVVVSFRSDVLVRILVFSFLSFGHLLGMFYVALLLLSLLSGPEPMNRLVRIPLGCVDGWPASAKACLPFAVTAGLWWLLSWLLGWQQIISPPVSLAHRFEQAVVVGLESYQVWKFPVGILLVLHLLNSYIYFGQHPFWKYVSATAQTLLSPLKPVPLRAGRLDFAPLVGIALVFLGTHFMENGLQSPPRKGPRGQPVAPLIQIPGLVDIYKKLPL